jgi:hypothetical protein
VRLAQGAAAATDAAAWLSTLCRPIELLQMQISRPAPERPGVAAPRDPERRQQRPPGRPAAAKTNTHARTQRTSRRLWAGKFVKLVDLTRPALRPAGGHMFSSGERDALAESNFAAGRPAGWLLRDLSDLGVDPKSKVLFPLGADQLEE